MTRLGPSTVRRLTDSEAVRFFCGHCDCIPGRHPATHVVETPDYDRLTTWRVMLCARAAAWVAERLGLALKTGNAEGVPSCPNN